MGTKWLPKVDIQGIWYLKLDPKWIHLGSLKWTLLPKPPKNGSQKWIPNGYLKWDTKNWIQNGYIWDPKKGPYFQNYPNIGYQMDPKMGSQKDPKMDPKRRTTMEPFWIQKGYHFWDPFYPKMGSPWDPFWIQCSVGVCSQCIIHCVLSALYIVFSLHYTLFYFYASERKQIYLKLLILLVFILS